MIANTLSHLHLLMRSSTPRLLSGIEQSQPPHAPGQGLDYFPSNLHLHDDKQLDLHYFDLQALKSLHSIPGTAASQIVFLNLRKGIVSKERMALSTSRPSP